MKGVDKNFFYQTLNLVTQDFRRSAIKKSLRKEYVGCIQKKSVDLKTRPSTEN